MNFGNGRREKWRKETIKCFVLNNILKIKEKEKIHLKIDFLINNK